MCANLYLGPEKLLEVWFAPSATALPVGASPLGLKAVPADDWVSMLDMVHCKILSVLESDTVDAYLLSESSMFVFPHKLILKTCGTTTLLLGLQRMLHIAAAHAGFPFTNAESVEDIRAAATPYRVFYSRKNFLFPDNQRGPHRSWKQEVNYLDEQLDGGSAYMVGKMNGDHWYLYITPANQELTPPITPQSESNEQVIPELGGAQAAGPDSGDEYVDETLEILMTDLDPEYAKQFFLSHASAVACDKVAADSKGPAGANGVNGDSSEPMDEVDVFSNGSDSDLHQGVDQKPQPDESLTTEGHTLGSVISDNCGLADVYPKSIYPDAKIDAYLFGPCGFSANGVVPAPVSTQDGEKKADHYFTVHVTPEDGFSYASFETNVPGGQKGRATTEIISQVVDIFKPGRFSVTLFEAKGRRANPYGAAGDQIRGLPGKKLADPVPGYKRVDRILHDFDDYNLVFRFYEKEGWAGDKSARVGEYE